ncbi:MAG: hypothetical protein LBQ62_01725 [Candidatus Accumulibacter sp.]|nr:hypothetical protein [Accumulibacter sp.]
MPLDGERFGIAFAEIGLDLARQGFRVRDAFGETGIGQDRQFDLGNIEPTAMFGCVVKRDALKAVIADMRGQFEA